MVVCHKYFSLLLHCHKCLSFVIVTLAVAIATDLASLFVCLASLPDVVTTVIFSCPQSIRGLWFFNHLEPFRLLSFVWLSYSLFRWASSLPDIVTPVRAPLSPFVFFCLFDYLIGSFRLATSLPDVVTPVRAPLSPFVFFRFLKLYFLVDCCCIGNKPYWARFAFHPLSFSCRLSCFYHFRSPSPQALVPQGFQFRKKIPHFLGSFLTFLWLGFSYSSFVFASLCRSRIDFVRLRFSIACRTCLMRNPYN